MKLARDDTGLDDRDEILAIDVFDLRESVSGQDDAASDRNGAPGPTRATGAGGHWDVARVGDRQRRRHVGSRARDHDRCDGPSRDVALVRLVGAARFGVRQYLGRAKPAFELALGAIERAARGQTHVRRGKKHGERS